MLNATTGEDWLGEFAGGLAIDQVAFGITLIGGDTVSTPGPVAFSLTALGTVVGASALRRNGARPGDDVYVSGTVGDAFLGLAVVQSRLEVAATEDRAWLVDRFRLPEPRLPLGLRLVGMATAAADLSDGLVADLGHICEASGCAATIEVAAVPLSAAAARAVTNRQPLHHRLLAGGDDYELVFAAPVSERAGIDRMSREVGVRVTRIGCFIEPTGGGPTVDVRDADGNRIELGHGGYQHFQEEQGQSEN
jgi:thiamine-monophosphate kinase